MDATPKHATGPRGHFLLGSMSTFQQDPLAFFQMLAREHGDEQIYPQRLGFY